MKKYFFYLIFIFSEANGYAFYIFENMARWMSNSLKSYFSSFYLRYWSRSIKDDLYASVQRAIELFKAPCVLAKNITIAFAFGSLLYQKISLKAVLLHNNKQTKRNLNIYLSTVYQRGDK